MDVYRIINLTIPPMDVKILLPGFNHGVVAKWKGKGLQNPDHGFKSRRRLFFYPTGLRVQTLTECRHPVDASFFYPTGSRVQTLAECRHPVDASFFIQPDYGFKHSQSVDIPSTPLFFIQPDHGFKHSQSVNIPSTPLFLSTRITGSNTHRV